MSNTFDLTIKHNLHVGMQNAINQIMHLEKLLGIANGEEAHIISVTSEEVVSQLENNIRSLSLIEPEGEQPEWIDVKEYLPEVGKRVMVVLSDGDRHYEPFGCEYRGNGLWRNDEDDNRETSIDDYSSKVSHWREMITGPVTLSEASNHSFQQGVPEEFIDQESDVHVNSQPLEFPYDFDWE